MHSSALFPRECEDGISYKSLSIHAGHLNTPHCSPLPVHLLPCSPPVSLNTEQALSFRLSRLDVRDLFTQGGVFPYLLKVGDGHDVGGGVDEDVYPGLSKTRAKVGRRHCVTEIVYLSFASVRIELAALCVVRPKLPAPCTRQNMTP